MRKTLLVVTLLLGFLPLQFCGSVANAMERHDMAGKTMVHASSYDVMPCCFDAHERDEGHGFLNEPSYRLLGLDILEIQHCNLSVTPNREKHPSALLRPDRGKFEEQGGIKRE